MRRKVGYPTALAVSILLIQFCVYVSAIARVKYLVLTKRNLDTQKLTNERVPSRRSNISIGHPIVHQYVSDHASNLDRRRLQLYPQWFAKRIPQLFGKTFARRYFYPYAKSHGRNKIQKSTDKEGIRRQLYEIAKTLHGDPNEYSLPPIQKHSEFLPLSPSLTRLSGSPVAKVMTPNIELLPDMATPLQAPSSPLVNEPMEYPGLPQYTLPTLYQPVQQPVLQFPAAVDLNDGGKVGEDWINYMKTAHTLSHHHPCHHKACLNNGHCHVYKHDHSKFGCKCKTGYSGHYCQIIQATCHPNPCFHGGTCTKIEHGYFCSCESDYKGTNCQLDAICFKNPCQNGGICTELEDDYYCECPKEFRGKDCNEKVNPCHSNPCKNSGTCIVKDDAYMCQCSPAYTCDDCSCEVEVNRTTTIVTTPSQNHMRPCPSGYCKNGGTCFSTKEGPVCTCAMAFRGIDCSAPNLCMPNPCENGGICLQDGEENYKCICPYGFKGPNCGDQLSCMSHPCLNSGKCHETATTFRCECAPGFKGKSCDQLSPCSKAPCQHILSCVENGPLFACQCAEGYRGKLCKEHDPCTPNPCINGRCRDVDGIRACNCTAGWIGDFCEVKDECHPNKCQNGGTCVHNGDHFHCVCLDGFFGNHCQHPSPCLSNPCGRNGACHITDYGYICVCHEGYRGKQCDVRNKCHPNPCLNEGYCYEGDDDFICECPTGYTGRTCHIQDFCDPNPCRNGGSCFEKIGSFTCGCLPGFIGEKCEVDVCLHNPCRNNGVCVPSPTLHGYACECVFPFHGHNCQDTDPCAPNPCKNGGSCKTHLQGIAHFHDRPTTFSQDHLVTIVPDSYIGPHARAEHAEFHGNHFDSSLPGDHVDNQEPVQYTLHGPIDEDNDHGDRVSVEIHSDDHPVDDNNHGEFSKEVYHFSRPHNSGHDGTDWYYHEGNHHDSSDIGADSGPLLTRENEDHVDNKGIDDKAVKEIENHVFKAVLQAARKHGLTKRTKLANKSGSEFSESSSLSKKSSSNNYEKKSFILTHRKSLTHGQLIKRNRLARRTLQDLYVCHCPSGYLGAHCQRTVV